MATYGLDIVSSEAPDLPEGVERDPVRRQDDFGESADVFGYVTVRLNIDQSSVGSSRKLADWVQGHLRCDELAIGEIRYVDDSTLLSIHKSKIGTAMKALAQKAYEGHQLEPTIVG